MRAERRPRMPVQIFKTTPAQNAPSGADVDTPIHLPVMLRTSDIADKFGCSTRTVARWIKDGILPANSLRGTSYVRTEDVLALIRNQLQSSIEARLTRRARSRTSASP